ncbi:MAG: prepilin peptidase, partial [Candidatus Omnitrophica bacterium]|nr:prepilin peptidase [Candidatus Omnitrophota bacterium]
VVIVQRFGVHPVGIIYLVFVWALIVVSLIDLEHRIIPDEISVYGRWIGLTVSFLLPVLHATGSREMALGRSLIGAVVGGGLLYLTGVLGSLMFRKEAMGGGDVKLLAMAGSLLGWKLVTLTFFLAPLLAIVPGIGVLLLKRSHEIPYGPFLSAALIVSLFAGQQLIQLSGVEESIRLLWLYQGWGS